MRDLSQSPHICSVDPITLTGLALAAVGGATAATAASSGSSAPAPVTPSAPAPAAAAPPASNPLGQAKKPQAAQQSFIGAAATPNTQSGQKTLLGQ